LQQFDGARSVHDGHTLLLGPLGPRNAAALRDQLPWLKPRPLGLRTSAGLGDRMGLATPGHVRAIRAAGSVAPIFAQQSIREMTRTGRTPQQVMDDATWGIFQEGWQLGMGADADLKTTGMSTAAPPGPFFTSIRRHVNNSAEATFYLRNALAPTAADQQPPATGLLNKIPGRTSLHFDEHTY
jgi:hypothetical protein